jgi:hypothetical protein
MPDIFIDHTPHPKQTREVERPATRKTFPEKNLERPLARNHKLGLFSSFVRDPLGVALAEQHDDEHILLFIRRAFVTNIPWLVLTGFLLILPFFLPTLLSPLHLSSTVFNFSTVGILLIFYYIIVLGVALTHFLTWFYDIGIVTEKRAVDIDFYNISFVSVATARAQDLKDVRYAQKGFFESLFDYGDVTMVVEASGEVLTFENTRHPAEVVSMLSVLIGGHQE